MELVPLGDEFSVDGLSLEGRGRPTIMQCEAALGRVRLVFGAAKYWLGDLMNLTETLFAEEASQLIDQSFLSEKDAKAFMFVAAKVAPSVRAHAQSWDHARVVAGLTPEAQVEWLDRAREDDWTARKLASELAQAKAGGKVVMRWWLVVECGTEEKREKLAEDIEARGGFIVKRQEKLARERKAPKAKAGPLTAQKKRRGAPKRNTVRRVPK